MPLQRCKWHKWGNIFWANQHLNDCWLGSHLPGLCGLSPLQLTERVILHFAAKGNVATTDLSDHFHIQTLKFGLGFEPFDSSLMAGFAVQLRFVWAIWLFTHMAPFKVLQVGFLHCHWSSSGARDSCSKSSETPTTSSHSITALQQLHRRPAAQWHTPSEEQLWVSRALDVRVHSLYHRTNRVPVDISCCMHASSSTALASASSAGLSITAL